MRHWHFRRQLVAGPDFEEEGQLESPDLVAAWLMRPDDSDLLVWAKTCCSVGPFVGMHPLGGWSPGRSVPATLLLQDGTLDKVFYKLLDEDESDVAGHPDPDTWSNDAMLWFPVWERFLSACLHFELRDSRPNLVMEVAQREVEAWDGGVVVDLARSAPRPSVGSSTHHARTALVQYTAQWYEQAIFRRASLLDSRIFLLYPELILQHTVLRRRAPGATR